MTIKELIERLQKFSPDTSIMMLDSQNGGAPRDINLGPTTHTITRAEAEDYYDCEEREGESVVVIGFGSY